MNKYKVALNITGLREAEYQFSEAVDLIQPLLESIHTSDAEHFFDRLISLLPDDGDLEDFYYNSSIGEVVNYDILCNVSEASITNMRPSITSFYDTFGSDILRRYDILDVSRVNNHNVIITFIPKE